MTMLERMAVIDSLNEMWAAFASIAKPYRDAKAIMAVVQAKDRIHQILSEDGKGAAPELLEEGKEE